MIAKKTIFILLLLSLVFSVNPSLNTMKSVSAASIEAQSAFPDLDNDMNTLYTDLPSYPDYGNKSSITLFGSTAFAVLLDKMKYPIIGASRYGSGRVIAAGTESFINFNASLNSVEEKITRNILIWLTEDKSPNPTTGITNRYSNALNGTEKLKIITKDNFSISSTLSIEKVVVSRWDSQALDPLVNPVAFVSPNTVSRSEAEALDVYVKNGGSILVAYKGWVMESYPADAIRAQAKDPKNVKVTDYPVQWLLNQAGLSMNSDILNNPAPNLRPIPEQNKMVNLTNIVDALQQIENKAKTFMDYATETEKAPTDVWSRMNTFVFRSLSSITVDNSYLAAFKSASDSIMNNLSWPIERLEKPYTSMLINYSALNASLDNPGVKFPDADLFPGKVDSTTPRVSKTISVNMEYANNDYMRISVTPGYWVSTGTYAPAGNEITIEVPADEPDLDVQIGAHTDDLRTTSATKLERLPKITLKKRLKPGLNKINSPYGGLVYIIPTTSKPGRAVNVIIGGVIDAPYYVLGKTSDQQWKDTIRNYPAPWAELQSNHIIITVPSEDIRSLDNPKQLMEKWDELYSLYEKLAGLAPDKPLPNKSIDWPYRYVADKQISAGWMHSGYPIMLFQGESSKRLVSIEDIQHTEWGFWHELGHDFQMSSWTWTGNTEVTVNLHSLHVQEYFGDASRLVESFPAATQYLESTGPDKNFDTIEDVFVKLVMFTQLKYAYGWDFYAKLYTTYREMDSASLPGTEQQKADTFVITTSKLAGENLLEFFDKWGVKYTSVARNAITALKLPKPSVPIWLIPATESTNPISLDATKYMLGIGGTHATVVRFNEADKNTSIITSGLTFISSNPAVATVNDGGLVTGVSRGTVTISTNYKSGSISYTRYSTVVIDPKAPSFLQVSDVKRGVISVSVIDSDNNPVSDAIVKISQGALIYPLVTTNVQGSVYQNVPAGTYNVIVYALNGNTIKNAAFNGLKVVAGQKNSPLSSLQLTLGTMALTVNTIKGSDKRITGTTLAGASVTAREGILQLGTTKADKLGRFTLNLSAIQPGKTITITSIDQNETETTSSVQLPKVVAVWTAATKANDVEHDFVLTFKDPAGQLAKTVTSVQIGDNTPLVKGTGYTIAGGTLTIKKGAVMKSGTYNITVKASYYSDSTVSQTIKAGVANAEQSSISLSAPLAAGQKSTVTAFVNDQYGNLSAGKQLFADITVTNAMKAKTEKYTLGSMDYGTTMKGKTVGAVTNDGGMTTFIVAIPAEVDTGDGVSIQFKTGATAATATAIGSPITFTKT